MTARERAAPPSAAAEGELALLGLPGIAARRAALYAAAGLRTRRQLLYHLPVRYRIRPPARPLRALLDEATAAPPVAMASAASGADRSAMRGEAARTRNGSSDASSAAPGGAALGAVSGTVQRASVRRRGRRSTVSLALLCDGGGQLTVLLFNRAYLARSLRRGTRLWVAGRVQPADAEHALPRLVAADYEALPDDEVAPPDRPPCDALPPLPIYRLPAGVPPRVHRKLLGGIL